MKCKIYRNKDGEKLYPLCNWERNQHIFYNYADRCANAYYDSETQEAYDEWQEAQRLIGVFDRYIINGIAYTTYKDRVKMLNIIGGYQMRHDFLAKSH